MKLAVIDHEGKQTLGIWTSGGIVNMAKAAEVYGNGGTSLLGEMMDVIREGEAAVEALRSLLAQLPPQPDRSVLISEEELSFGPCVPAPQKIICVGLNYRRHAEETNSPIPEYPILFNKFNNSLTGHQASVAVPGVTAKLDYEAELAIVIGRRAKNVSRDEALDYVFGYTAVNDLSARDLQLRTQQWLLGKSCDGFCPIGPYLVTADEIGDPNRLAIQSIVNGEIRQDSNTSDMIFACDEIVSYISRHMTLEPGDVILTGTPEGVVLGLPAERQVYLKPGDEVSICIEKIGTLTNRFVAEA
ncbi:fumarylacetoacetate hydrolase family protein [Cohnella sp. LGH]|uniref:fumarylacetoacetate hydrolase family protein n=1 Tax=Cohnella sp. LGH TaxID=1619153 RepID=UPI001FFDF127|nr:fumarylacetoacetate hydrolase family protein [Cohnella sp. LGH]